jgi:N4-gp56 family major capsid protein
MSKTEFGVNHTLSNKLWSKKLAVEAIRATWMGKFIGDDDNALIREKVELKKDAGDKITCGLLLQLSGDGIQGDATLEGNEESMQFFNDSIFLDQLRHAVRLNGKMTEKRVPYDLRMRAKDLLKDWYAKRMDTAFFNHICGNTAVTDAKYTGLNAVTAPTTNRIIRPNSVATDEALTSTDIMSLELIDYAKEKATTANTDVAETGPLVRPVMVEGSEMYVMFLHDYQVTDLRTSTSTGQWLDIQKAAMQGGDVAKNPIFSGALGVYNQVVLHQAARVTTGVNSTTGAADTDTRRAVLCGANAAMIAFGGAESDTRYSWKEKLFDYDNQFGVAAGAIWGLKKSVYAPESGSTNQEDYGTVVVSTYAAAHA